MNDENNTLKLPITILMTDGRQLIGDLVVNIGGALERTMNNDARFITFADLDGSVRMISKASIAEVMSRKAAKVVNLPSSDRLDNMDPHALLNVVPGASAQEVHEAWRAQARLYHPDKFAKVDLPPEMRSYTNSMSRRINEAYALLKAQHRTEPARAR
ncbi:MAG: J domain-containing protein [Ahrensia sp.]|nr:J domain-containing protein [Ahrensia sp.]